MKIKFTLSLVILAIMVFALFGQDEEVSTRVIIEVNDEKQMELNQLFSTIIAKSGAPVLFESNVALDANIRLMPGKYSRDQILCEICKQLKGHFFFMENGVICVKEKEFSSNKDFIDYINRYLVIPNKDKLDGWGISFDVPEKTEIHWAIPDEEVTEDLKKAVEEDSKRARAIDIQNTNKLVGLFRLRIALETRRFYPSSGIEPEWTTPVDKFNGKSVRDALIEIISANKLYCRIYEITGGGRKIMVDEIAVFVKQLQEQKRNQEITEGMLELLKPGPIYGIEIYRADYDPEKFDEGTEEASVKPEQEKPSIPDVPVSFDGKRLLKVNSVFSKKKNSLMVTIENVSAGKMIFRSIKDDFIIMELYDDKRGDTFERAIYAGEKTELPASFNLAPGEKKSFEFKFDGARFKEKYGRPFLIKEAGTENQLRLDKVPFKELSDLGARIETFYPIIYFDLDGKRHKSSGEEALMDQE